MCAESAERVCVGAGGGRGFSDSHLELPTVGHSMRRLEEVELPPFQAAADAGVAAIMVAHVTVPALDRFGAHPPHSTRPRRTRNNTTSQLGL